MLLSPAVTTAYSRGLGVEERNHLHPSPSWRTKHFSSSKGDLIFPLQPFPAALVCPLPWGQESPIIHHLPSFPAAVAIHTPVALMVWGDPEGRKQQPRGKPSKDCGKYTVMFPNNSLSASNSLHL